MSTPLDAPRPRILIVDDNSAIHEDFRKILGIGSDSQSRLDTAEAALFGHSLAPKQSTGFRIESAFQGQEALALVGKAMQENDPYVLAFVDVRMPPGWDGIETLERLWQVAPDLQAVISTAYSDYSWDDMIRRFGHKDNLLILKKPFEVMEVLQMAHALTQKWSLARQARLRMEDLDRMVRQRTEELVRTNGKLRQEIEGRIRAQEELRVSEERFSKAFHSNPGPAAILSAANRRFLDVNESFEKLCGYAATELAGSTDTELQLWKTGEGDSAGTVVLRERLRNHPCTLQCKGGSVRQVILSVEPVSLGGAACLLLNVVDTTEQAKLEAQLRQSQKLEVVGRMAAGIAHEFNNVLTVIQGDVGLLQNVNFDALDRRALLDQIMQASQRAASFTKQLLAFSRKQVLQPRSLDLFTVLQTMEKMLGRLIGEKFEIRLSRSGETFPVTADESGIEQIVINLVLNARDAMPEGGRIEIQIETRELNPTEAASNPEARPGRFVSLSVSDHGCGMSPEVRARIFDPFFTTKAVGKGTGLGLATIHGIVKQHDGWIEVHSEPGRGSRFQILLPVSDAPVVAPENGSNATRANAPGAQRGETIFVVEDEQPVRDLASIALRKRGYRVLTAASGAEAMEAMERFSGRVNLLLTDMVMPGGISGGELAKTLQARNPEMRVIYTSGYSPEILRREFLVLPEINFLPKPYDLQALLEAIRTCLDGGKLAPCEVRPELEAALV